MNQITMRGVNFDYAKAGIARAPRRVGKSPNDLLNAIDRERLRCRIIIGKRNRAWRHHVLPAAFGFRNNSITFPWSSRARFAPGMRQLHTRNAALFMNEADDVLYKIDMFVFPDAEVLRT